MITMLMNLSPQSSEPKIGLKGYKHRNIFVELHKIWSTDSNENTRKVFQVFRFIRWQPSPNCPKILAFELYIERDTNDHRLPGSTSSTNVYSNANKYCIHHVTTITPTPLPYFSTPNSINESYNSLKDKNNKYLNSNTFICHGLTNGFQFS